MLKRILQFGFVLLAGLSFFLFFYLGLDVYFSIENIRNVKVFFLGLGNWSLFYIVIIHIVLNVTGIPRVFFTIFSGYVYGILWGFIFSWIATMAGLIVTFLMVRYLFRESFEHKFGSKRIVERINRRIDQYGIWTVVFLRAIYVVPSSILNYSFGFTKIKTRDYLLGSAIGFLPVVLLNVWFGYSIGNEMVDGVGLNYWIILTGIVGFGLVYLLKNIASKYFRLR
jgi:uncharacterized membrane protein YdjX (TVP38/TMEM64 family)